MSKPKSTKTKKAAVSTVKTKPVKSIKTNGKHPQEPSTAMKAGLAAVAAMPPTPPKETKLSLIIKLLSRPEGATIDDMVAVTGWQKHTLRAALSHALVKKRGYQIVSDKPQGGQRLYKIVEPV
ncbi:MAG: DUF3489 domain-containing protein [Alphaproteobacteria bacterium]|nr:MAG: DUF3489 domain-containing protein [Alphaproteobacteria bacterium]